MKLRLASSASDTPPPGPRKPGGNSQTTTRLVLPVDALEPPQPLQTDDSLRTPWENPRTRIAAVSVGALVLACVVVVMVYTLNKPHTGREHAQGHSTATPSVNSTPPSAPSTPPSPNPDSPGPARIDPKAPDAGPPRGMDPPPMVAPKEGPPKDPPPKFVPKDPPPPTVFDPFGNAVGTDYGLGRTGEFAGQRILIWGGHTAYGKVFFSGANPLWKGLEELGFSVRREFGAFDPAWLAAADQVWILSSSSVDPPTPAEALGEYLKQELARNPPSRRPFGWSDSNFTKAAAADAELFLSPKFPLSDESLAAVAVFAQSGKGVCLLAGPDPYNLEADALAGRLLGSSVNGSFSAHRVVRVRPRELPADVARRVVDRVYDVGDHPLLTGVNFLYEGLTVGRIRPSDKLSVAFSSSEGKPLVAMSAAPGLRVVVDAGATRYRLGPNNDTSFILRTAGGVRLAQNIAAYLAGKDVSKKP